MDNPQSPRRIRPTDPKLAEIFDLKIQLEILQWASEQTDIKAKKRQFYKACLLDSKSRKDRDKHRRIRYSADARIAANYKAAARIIAQIKQLESECEVIGPPPGAAVSAPIPAPTDAELDDLKADLGL